MRSGEIVVFGSAALAFRLPDAPATRDVDIWCSPAEAGKTIEALMGELSWYHDRNGSYVEVWGPETFRAPSDWRARAREFTDDQLPDLRLIVPHPHDILFAKLERWEDQDRDHARRILSAYPLRIAQAGTLDARMPYRDGTITDPGRIQAYDVHYRALLSLLPV